MKKLVQLLVLAVLVIAILLFNPFFGPARFDYNEADMKRAIEGTWKLAYDRKSFDLTIMEEHAATRHSSTGWINSAEACGTRSFVNTADACIDDSAMDVDVVIANTHNHGVFRVLGTEFRQGFFQTEIDKLYITAHVDPNGNVSELEVLDNGVHADQPSLSRK